MKILIINPNSDTHTDAIMAEKAKALSLPGVDVDVIHMKSAPKLVCSYEEQTVSIEEMVNAVKSTAGIYDAYVIACHSDPNLDLIREITSKPVVGIGESSMKFASMMGNGFAVISPSLKSISKKIALAHKYHCDDLLKTIQVTKSDSNEDLLLAAERALQEFGVDVIVLGCANYAGADAYIEQKLHVPVLDGVACALILASGLACYYKLKN
ncbi:MULTISPECIES: aspartate/glutamate racemase family protein [Acidaminococcus]|jgi:allantoin racemase|uniref:aspartate/glutamate racemase family protein n=1 Tax=Acidaminococcus TaxID=904 RepID=UPI00054F10B4|nr:aspartate/glutamate racemase family protein [Acidaminococcus sp. BV3L6]